VDDTYNANPDSVRAAIDVLAELPGPRLLVLGDMGEVGDQGPQFHAEVGAYARDAASSRCWRTARWRSTRHGLWWGRHFDDIAALNDAVRTRVAAVQRLRQRLALHAHGAGDRGHVGPHDGTEEEDAVMLLSLAPGCRPCRPNSGSSASSSTSRSAP
jgi:hypothetical protein